MAHAHVGYVATCGGVIRDTGLNELSSTEYEFSVPNESYVEKIGLRRLGLYVCTLRTYKLKLGLGNATAVRSSAKLE